MNGIEIDGMEELQNLLQDMSLSEADEKKAMKKAITPVSNEVQRNTPYRTGRLKKSVKATVKKEGFATVGIVRTGQFYDIFEEYGTSKSKKNVGFFERSVNKTQNEAISILANELLK